MDTKECNMLKSCQEASQMTAFAFFVCLMVSLPHGHLGD